MGRSESADTPSGPHVRGHQAVHDLLGAVRRYDAGPQAMPGVRSNGQDFVLLTVQRIHVEAELVVPKNRVEALKQRCGLCPQFSGAVVLAERLKHFRRTNPGIVDITLKLAQRLWPFDQRAIRIDDGVAGILPSHVLITDRGARLIFLEAVTVAVSIFVDPGQAAFNGPEMPLQKRLVGSRTPSRVQRDQIERCGVSRAVIWRVRDQLEMRELTVAQFVEDLSRFRIPIWVVFPRLQRAEEVQSTTSELWIDQHVLKRGDKAVAPERGDEPGEASRRQESLAVRSLDRKAERGHVFQCTAKQPVEFLVARLNLGNCLQPASQRLGVLGPLAAFDAIARRIEMPVAVLEHIQDAAVPGLSWSESDFEAEPAIGIVCLSGRSRRVDRHRSAEITVAVGGTKPLSGRRPLRCYPPASDDSIRFHLEDVGKVAAYRDLELELYRAHTVVCDVNIFVDAAADPAADGQSECTGRNRAVLGCNRGIRQKNPCRVIGNGAAIEQLPGFAISVDGPAADQSRIEKIQPLF